jgi:hypothetical protein
VCWYEPRAVHIRALPGDGCAHFSRVPGVDDEPGPPAGFQGSETGGWRANLRLNSSSDLYRLGIHPFVESIHPAA